MAGRRYLAKNRKKLSERNSERGKRGNEVKRQRMKERGDRLEVVGGCKTYGCLGEKHIELMACDEANMVWIRLDGELRQPRTMRGFLSVLFRWFYRKGMRNDIH